MQPVETVFRFFYGLSEIMMYITGLLIYLMPIGISKQFLPFAM